MATIRRFQDIEAWQVARDLARVVYAVSNKGSFARDFGLHDQIRRASVSILSNIAEGFERCGKTEFLHFLSMAKGSAGEVEAQLYVAFDQEYIDESELNEIVRRVTSTKKLLAGFMNYLRDSDIRGQKYKRE